MIKKYLFQFALFLACAAAPASILEAASLHAIIVADTLDDTIGEYTKVDVNNMRAAMDKIARQTKLKLKMEIISGKNVTPTIVLNKLNKLSIKPDDVVVFFYSGHGYRTPSKGDVLWPNLFFSKTETGVDFKFISDKLTKQNPRLLLAIVDVCNNVIEDIEAPRLVQKIALTKAKTDNQIKNNYRQLFLNTRGVILIATAEPGEYSWIAPEGSLFTLAFLRFLDEEVRSTDTPTWENILANAALSLQDTEHPIYDLNLQ